ncbi:type II secretion system F family protein [Roseimaritima ulvae]|uniref:Bacterial type II secretion system protein F domain protein n=1 Tax=Roseimaritima ulvae TaxID=980254 RepID=A0A5B9QPH1_9BACT|nr:type II secretion system F family protein [Roseimaritima ulvae]QEG40854.1 Bacterial type II secretion system protein F domain protein [Roseimaritima ulvae]
MGYVLFGFFGLMFLGGLAGIAVAAYRSQSAAVSRGRLDAGAASIRDSHSESNQLSPASARRSPVLRRYAWIGLFVAALVVLVLRSTLGIPWPYLAAIYVMAFLCCWQLDTIWLQYRIGKLEQQLADAIDMMVAGVKSGSSLQAALESSVVEARQPWRQEVQQMVSAIRYGQDPVEAAMDLSDRLPLERVTLFSQTLAVNWRVGGKLSVTLANVGRTIRDRIELSRRMHAMTTQARMSVISVVVVTYFIGALIWRNDPERMNGFLTSMIGQVLVSIGMALQAVGVVWISWMSKPKF